MILRLVTRNTDRTRPHTAYLLGILLAAITCTESFAGKVTFPEDFKWCVSTAAHQIEGNNVNSDWWAWENDPTQNRPKSGLACDSWNRVNEDITLIQALHANTYRFSVEWAKIEPLEGLIDESAVAHYRKEVIDLQKAGITPIITLQHFTFPLWVSQKGGWEWEGISDALSRYAELVYTEIGPELQTWITINEPMNYLLAAYVGGAVPPGEKRKLKEIIPAIRGVLKSHAKIYHRLHELAENQKLGFAHPVQVGMALQLREMQPLNRWNPLDHLAAWAARSAFNWTIPNALTSGRLQIHIWTQVSVDEEIPDLAQTQDYLGINFYGGDLIEFSASEGFKEHNWDSIPEKKLKSHLGDHFGKEIRPQVFYQFVKEISAKYVGKPIFITENGIADPPRELSSDNPQDPAGPETKRIQFLKDHLKYLAKAIEEGAPVKGYCYWSLMDNFEWVDGFKDRFGLYETDYTTLERRPRPSAEVFRNIAIHQGFEE